MQAGSTTAQQRSASLRLNANKMNLHWVSLQARWQKSIAGLLDGVPYNLVSIVITLMVGGAENLNLLCITRI